MVLLEHLILVKDKNCLVFVCLQDTQLLKEISFQQNEEFKEILFFNNKYHIRTQSQIVLLDKSLTEYQVISTTEFKNILKIMPTKSGFLVFTSDHKVFGFKPQRKVWFQYFVPPGMTVQNVQSSSLSELIIFILEQNDDNFQHFFAVFREGNQHFLFFYKLNKHLMRVQILGEEQLGFFNEFQFTIFDLKSLKIIDKRKFSTERLMDLMWMDSDYLILKFFPNKHGSLKINKKGFMKQNNIKYFNKLNDSQELLDVRGGRMVLVTNPEIYTIIPLVNQQIISKINRQQKGLFSVKIKIIKSMKLSLMIKLVFILTQSLGVTSKFSETSTQQLENIKKSALSNLSFLVEEMDSYKGFTLLKDLLLKYFQLDESATQISDLLITLYNKEFEPFTQQNQLTLENIVMKEIQAIVSSSLSTQDVKTRLEYLFQNTQKYYLQKFLHQLYQNDFQEGKCSVQLDMDFNKLVVQAYRVIKNMDPDIQKILNSESLSLNEKFQKTLKKEYLIMFQYYCQLKINHGSDLMLKATYLMITLNREEDKNEDDYIERFGALVHSFNDILKQEVQEKIKNSNEEEAEEPDAMELENSNLTQPLRNLEILLNREHNYNLNNKRDNKKLEKLSMKYIEVVQMFNVHRAYNFMHSYFANNLVTWSPNEDVPYLVDAGEKFSSLSENSELQNRLETDQMLQIELLDLVTQQPSRVHNEQDLEIILEQFHNLTDYPITFLSNKSLYFVYKSSICDIDEEFNRILISLVQEYRLEHRNEEFLMNENLTAIKFDHHIRGLYHALKDKEDRTDEEEYIFNNYLHFVMAIDLLVFGSIDPKEEYGFDFKAKFDFTPDQIEHLYNSYEDYEANLDTCTISEEAFPTSTYIYNMFKEVADKDEDGEVYFQNALRYYLTKEINFKEIKKGNPFFDMKITQNTVQTEQNSSNQDIDFSAQFKTYQLTPQDLVAQNQINQDIIQKPNEVPISSENQQKTPQGKHPIQEEEKISSEIPDSNKEKPIEKIVDNGLPAHKEVSESKDDSSEQSPIKNKKEKEIIVETSNLSTVSDNDVSPSKSIVEKEQEENKNPKKMVKLAENLVGIHNQKELPEEIQNILKNPNVKEELENFKTGDGSVRIPVGNKVYEITYVRVVPPSDCMAEFKKREMNKLRKTLNLMNI